MFSPKALCDVVPKPKLFFFLFSCAMKSKLGSALAISLLFYMSWEVGESSTTSLIGFLVSSVYSFSLLVPSLSSNKLHIMASVYFIEPSGACLGERSLTIVLRRIRGDTAPMAMVLVGEHDVTGSVLSLKRQIQRLLTMSYRCKSFNSLVTSKMPPKITM